MVGAIIKNIIIDNKYTNCVVLEKVLGTMMERPPPTPPLMTLIHVSFLQPQVSEKHASEVGWVAFFEEALIALRLSIVGLHLL